MSNIPFYLMDPILLHLHIFKNAGTAFDSILKKNFKKNFSKLDDKDPSKMLYIDSIIDYLNKKPSVTVISSHQIRPPFENTEKFHFIPVVFLRHPIDRIYSIYEHYRRSPEKHPFNFAAKKYNLNDFLKWYLKNQPNNLVMKNFQTYVLSHDPKNPAFIPHNAISISVNRLKNFFLLGLVERFNESLNTFDKYLEDYFGKLKFSFEKKNVNPNREFKLEDRLNYIKSELNDDLHKQFFKINKLDLELYQIANKELDDRLKILGKI